MVKYIPKMVELLGQSEGELMGAVSRAREELFRLKFMHASRQLRDTSKLFKKRHEIARLLTVLSQKRSGADGLGA